MCWIHIITIEVHFATVTERWSPRPLSFAYEGRMPKMRRIGGVDSGLAINSRKTVINIKI